MQLTVRLLGVEFIYLDLSDSPSPESEDERGFDYTTYPVGFASPSVVPDMVDLPDRGS